MIIHNLSNRNPPSCTSENRPLFGTTEQTLAVEHHIDVFVNDKPAMHLVCTPEHLDELVVGRLFTEGMISGTEDVVGLHICETGCIAKVYLKESAFGKLGKQTVSQVPTCCTDNRVMLKGTACSGKSLAPLKWEPEHILAMVAEKNRDAPLYAETKAVHGSMLIKKAGILCFREDIGRHNALDKVIGYALLNNTNLSACLLYTTGRLPTDMVSKVIRAGIPLLISKTFPTEQAVNLARSANLTILTVRESSSLIQWN